MRIIAGKYGGRKIYTPKGLPVRPTTDRTKEALFNILNHHVEWAETRVLDLFAGTGNISLECWSRGAKEVISVDVNAKCVAAIKAARTELGITGGKVFRMDVRRFVKQTRDQYELIFMDPPYAMAGQEELIRQIIDRQVLAPAGMLVVEHASHFQFSSLPGFDFVKKYGSSSLSFFKVENVL